MHHDIHAFFYVHHELLLNSIRQKSEICFGSQYKNVLRSDGLNEAVGEYCLYFASQCDNLIYTEECRKKNNNNRALIY